MNYHFTNLLNKDVQEFDDLYKKWLYDYPEQPHMKDNTPKEELAKGDFLKLDFNSFVYDPERDLWVNPDYDH